MPFTPLQCCVFCGFSYFFLFSFFFVLFLFVSLLCLLQLMCNCRWLWAVACGSEWVRGWVRARGSMGLTESCKDTRRLTNDTHRTSNTHTSTRAAYDTLKCIFFCCFPFDFALLLHPASGRWGVACWGESPHSSFILFLYFLYISSFFALFGKLLTLYFSSCDLFYFIWRSSPTHPIRFMFPSLRYVFLRHFTFVSTFAVAFLRLLCLLWSLNCPAMYAKVSRLRFLWLSLWVEKKLKCCSFDATFWPKFLYIFSQLPASDGQAAYISASNLPVS